MSVFISYRRDGGKPVAEAIYQTLHKDYNVFLDTESLKNGYFDSAITTYIEDCTDFIIIITETVFNRCNEPNDWIFHEAQIALREHKNIIPIFVGIQKFPSNVPEPLKEICRYNGIFWNDGAEIFAKIKAFLLSNHLYNLLVVKNDNRIALADQSKKDLKELYQIFMRNGRHSVDIDIELSDPKALSELLIREDIVGGYGVDFAKQIAEQSLLKKTKHVKETLKIAIEYLLQDEMIDTCAMKVNCAYIEKYGITNCSFADSDGIEHPYWTVFAWFDIIEELLKELILDRYYCYGNSKEFTQIDCFAETRSGKEIWSFSSFIRKQAEESYTKLMEILRMPGGRADYMDIPLCSLIHHVYPDLYYNIGQLKANQTNQSFEEVNKYNGVFNLWYYYIGLH